LIVADAPSARARSSFASLDEVTITCAPAASANCSAKIDTPPVPSVSTVCPGSTGAPAHINAFHAVTPAHGRHADSSNDNASGSGTTPFSYRTTCSASTPSSGEASAASVAQGDPFG